MCDYAALNAALHKHEKKKKNVIIQAGYVDVGRDTGTSVDVGPSVLDMYVLCAMSMMWLSSEFTVQRVKDRNKLFEIVNVNYYE